jgi:two-component system, sensor histidine kinase PdtaS
MPFNTFGHMITLPRSQLRSPDSIEEAEDMSIAQSPSSAIESLNAILASPGPRTAASYESELADHREIEIRLRDELAHDEDLLRQKDQVISQQALLSKESNHRLFNDLQMIVSLLSLQSRKSENAEAGSQLAAAASRIATIGRVHRRLHFFDGEPTIALKQYLDDFCHDFSMLLSSEQTIVVEGIEINLPSAVGIPLSFIVNELITNAVKYGKGRITVRLEGSLEAGYALSVSNDGPALPEGFDLTAGKGQGMRIVRSFVERIGGELRIGRCDNNQGTRFTVLFSGSPRNG